ncbi:MAG: hypothetical protein R2882_10220 [Gemmatimonadales bacterium]
MSPLIFPGGNNSPPTVEIASPTDGQLFAFTSSAGAPVDLVADLTDPDPADTHTCSIDWEGATSDGTVDEADGTGTCTGSFVYDTPGVYTIAVTVADPLGETSATDSVMIVVYDPSGGFVTGGGWIDAAAGPIRGTRNSPGRPPSASWRSTRRAPTCRTATPSSSSTRPE